MGFPWTQADPAELSFAVLVPTNHVIAAAIFLNGHMAFWTLLSEEESDDLYVLQRLIPNNK